MNHFILTTARRISAAAEKHINVAKATGLGIYHEPPVPDEEGRRYGINRIQRRAMFDIYALFANGRYGRALAREFIGGFSK